MSSSDLTRPETLYQQVAQRLRQDIDTGKYMPGDLLPSEPQLSRHYNVSRQTVRQAIAVLRAEGLLEVEQGRGTFVRQPPLRLRLNRYARHTRQPGAGPFEATCARLGIPGYGELVLVEQRAAQDAIAEGLEVPAGTEIVYRRRYMHAGEDDAIVQIQEGHLPLNLVENTLLARPEKVTDGTYAALDAIGHGPEQVTEEVTARMPTHSEATVFRAKTGVPVIQVIRTTRDKHGHVVELLYVTAVADQNVFLYENLPIT